MCSSQGAHPIQHLTSRPPFTIIDEYIIILSAAVATTVAYASCIVHHAWCMLWTVATNLFWICNVHKDKIYSFSKDEWLQIVIKCSFQQMLNSNSRKKKGSYLCVTFLQHRDSSNEFGLICSILSNVSKHGHCGHRVVLSIVCILLSILSFELFLLRFVPFRHSITSSDRNWTKNDRMKEERIVLFVPSFIFLVFVCACHCINHFALISSNLMSILCVCVYVLILFLFRCFVNRVYNRNYWKYKKKVQTNQCNDKIFRNRITVIKFGLDIEFGLSQNHRLIVCYCCLAKHQKISNPMLNGRKRE